MPSNDCFPTIRQLAAYEVWCNTQALNAAAALDNSRLFQKFPFGFGTIHATLFHTVEVFQSWGGCVGPTIQKPQWEDYDPAMTMPQMIDWNAGLSDAFMDAIDESHAADLLHVDRRLVQVFHLVTHGTHHRTQFISMLRMLGIDPPYEPGDFGGWSQARTRGAP